MDDFQNFLPLSFGVQKQLRIDGSPHEVKDPLGSKQKKKGGGDGKVSTAIRSGDSGDGGGASRKGDVSKVEIVVSLWWCW